SGQRAQNTVDVSERALERRQQFLGRRALTCGKFLCAMPLECFTADARHDPLSKVAVQMQQQVADAVRSFIRTPPQSLLRQRVDSETKFRGIFAREIVARAIDEQSIEMMCNHHVCSRYFNVLIR